MSEPIGDLSNRMRDIFHERRDLIVSLLNQVPGVSCQSPGGAFYVWPNVTEACAMIGARGCVAFDAATQTYSITVAWQGLSRTAAPDASVPCAQGLYGDDAQRRVVVLTMQIANI